MRCERARAGSSHQRAQGPGYRLPCACLHLRSHAVSPSVTRGAARYEGYGYEYERFGNYRTVCAQYRAVPAAPAPPPWPCARALLRPAICCPLGVAMSHTSQPVAVTCWQAAISHIISIYNAPRKIANKARARPAAKTKNKYQTGKPQRVFKNVRQTYPSHSSSSYGGSGQDSTRSTSAHSQANLKVLKVNICAIESNNKHKIVFAIFFWRIPDYEEAGVPVSGFCMPQARNERPPQLVHPPQRWHTRRGCTCRR